MRWWVLRGLLVVIVQHIQILNHYTVSWNWCCISYTSIKGMYKHKEGQSSCPATYQRYHSSWPSARSSWRRGQRQWWCSPAGSVPPQPPSSGSHWKTWVPGVRRQWAPSYLVQKRNGPSQRAILCQNSARTKTEMKCAGSLQWQKLRNTNPFSGRGLTQLQHSSWLPEFTNIQICNGSSYDSSKLTWPSSLKAHSRLAILWAAVALFPNGEMKKCPS